MSLPTSLFFMSMTLPSRIFGKLPKWFYGKQSLAGMQGCLQILLHDSRRYWHLEFTESEFAVRGLPCLLPRAQLEMTETTFLKLLAGELDFSTALMLGSIKGTGDGEMYFAFASLVERYRSLCRKTGVTGWLFRRSQTMVRKTLRKSL